MGAFPWLVVLVGSRGCLRFCWFLAARGHPAYLGESVCEALAAALIPMHEWLDELHAKSTSQGRVRRIMAASVPASEPPKVTTGEWAQSWPQRCTTSDSSRV